VTRNATTGDVEAHVGAELQTYSKEAPKIVLTHPTLSASDPGDFVAVRVAVIIVDLTWIPEATNIPATRLVAETTMRRKNAN
jgi:hypothetical protein